MEYNRINNWTDTHLILPIGPPVCYWGYLFVNLQCFSVKLFTLQSNKNIFFSSLCCNLI